MPGPDWNALVGALAALGERRLVLIEGEHQAALAQAEQILSELAPAGGLWAGVDADRPHPALTTVAPTAGRRWLGTETPLLVWDGWQGNPPDSLAAFAGTLRAGGLWFWLMPPLDTWSRFPDPDYHRMGLDQQGHHPFLSRLAGVIGQDQGVIRIIAGESMVLPRVPVPDNRGHFEVAGTDEQAGAIAAVIRVGQGRRRRPLVITADRGRGKSAALGIAAVRLLQDNRRRVAVVSPDRKSVDALFRHAAAEAGLSDEGIAQLEPAPGAWLSWYPVDELLASRPEAELVIVDEAAALPAPQLREILLGWPRVVFASTVHGYEGSGRGFNLRFRAVLDRETPRWQAMTLSTPIRWASSDPLEPLVNRLFLLDAEAVPEVSAGPVELEQWRPGEADEDELAQAFGLLVDAHYRTSPGDLRQWLDDPAAVSWLARSGDRVVGVLWATVEGGLDPDLARRVALGERRLRGHLLPQSLANHGGDAEAATLRILRVVRVAVHDQCRRQGIGHDLLKHATATASSLGLDAIGTSFGAAEDLLAFWQAGKFATVRLGVTREASSGEYGIQMVTGLNSEGQALQSRLASRFAAHWPVLLPVIWPHLASDVVLAVSADLPSPEPVSNQDRWEISAFAQGNRGFELTLPVLKKVSLQKEAVARLRALAGEGPEQAERLALWVRAVLQNHTWADLQRGGLCLGKRDGQNRLRALTTELMEAG